MSGSLILGEDRLATQTMLAQAARAAGGLARDFGVGEGDTVALLMRNDFGFLEATFAADRLGAYAVPINWHFKIDEIVHILKDSAAKVLVVHADLLAGLDVERLPAGLPLIVVATPAALQDAYALDAAVCAVPPGAVEWPRWRDTFEARSEPAPAERASMIYTSGTTGRPKGVRREPMQAHHLALIRERQALIGAAPEQVNLINGPLYHAAPNAQALAAVRAGGTLVIQPRFDAEDLLRLIERHRVSHMHMVPTMFVRLLRLPEAARRRYDLSSLCWILHAAAPCPPDVKRAMIDWWGPIINEYYGATETGMVVFCDSAQWLENPGTVGAPVPGAEIRILDDARRELGAGEVGEIFARYDGFSDFTYQNNDEARQENRHGTLFSVGDVGYLNDNGFLFISDRKRDMVISGGVNIYPVEIEAALLAHPEIRDCAVFGIPDSEFGEVLAVVIEPLASSSLDEPQVRAHIRSRLAGYKVPRIVIFDERMPREDSGKIRKRELRERYWQQAGRAI